MSGNIFKSLVTLILSITLLSGCNSANKSIPADPAALRVPDNSRISTDLIFLTSEACDGRRPGTSGNEKAAGYIARKFQEIGLKPFEDTYEVEYRDRTESLPEEQIRLELLDGEKVADKLEYGRDYVEVFLNNMDVTLPVVSQPSDTDCAVLMEDAQKDKEYGENSHIKLILQKRRDGAYKRGGYFYTQNTTPVIGLSSEAFARLQANSGKKIHFSVKIEQEESTLKNIAGVIPGESREVALLVSAHFDHVGSIGKPGSSEYILWPGALDNASGTATMLEAARHLIEFYRDKKPPCDIVFCAFNGEEVMIQSQSGSQFFLEHLREKYNAFFDINIDCVGNTGCETLYMSVNNSAASQDIAKMLRKAFESRKMKVSLQGADFMMSDHKNFEHAVGLATVTDYSDIHIPEDTPDKLDTGYLALLGNNLAVSIRNVADSIDFHQLESTGSEEDIESIQQGSEEVKLITTQAFEQKFGCKLDFIDHKKIRGIIASDQAKELSDVHTFFFVMDRAASVSFFTYKKDDPVDMEIYKDEMRINGYEKKAGVPSVTIGKQSYSIFTQEDIKAKSMVAECSNKNIIITVSITGQELMDINSPDQYASFLEANITEKFIEGMIKLLQEE